MTKKLAPPNYFKIFALLGAALLLVGLGLLVSHVTVFWTYAITYGGISFLLLGVAGMTVYKSKK
jgi:uncharacterized membrane-anchored protein